jgi:vacuolar-type H+-ATPase subunit C/Vma6
MRDYTFASALLATKSTALLTKLQFRELQTADDSGYVLKLQSLGYSVGIKNISVETIIENETINLKEELMQILPYDDLPFFFFSKYDLTNIRSLYKKKMLKAEEGTFLESGLLSKKDLEKAILKDDYFSIEEPYKSLFSLVSEKTFSTSQELANFIQGAFQNLIFNKIKERKDDVIEKYFVLSTDVNNLMSLLRARRMKLDEETFKANTLEHGELPASEVVALLKSTNREVAARYSSLHMGKFVLPLEQYFLDSDFELLEHALLRIILDENTDFKVDITSSAAIIDYVVRKQIEIIDIRRLYLDRNAVLMVRS